VKDVSTAGRSMPVVVSLSRKNGKAGEPRVNWCLGPSTGGASAWDSGCHPEKNFEIVQSTCKILQFSAFLA